MGLLKHDGCTKNSENVWINQGIWGTQSFAQDWFLELATGAGLATNSSLRIPVGAGLAANGKESQQQISIRLEVLESLENWKYVQGFRERLRNFRFVCFFLFAFQIHLIVVLWFSRFEWTPKPGELSILGRNKLSSHVPEKTNKWMPFEIQWPSTKCCETFEIHGVFSFFGGFFGSLVSSSHPRWRIACMALQCRRWDADRTELGGWWDDGKPDHHWIPNCSCL